MIAKVNTGARIQKVILVLKIGNSIISSCIFPVLMEGLHMQIKRHRGSDIAK